MKERTWDFIVGDAVTAETFGGKRVTGVIAGLDFGQGDDIHACVVAVIKRGKQTLHEVRPASLRYRVNRFGFYVKLNPYNGELVLGRNDMKLTDPQWFREKGYSGVCATLRPGKAK